MTDPDSPGDNSEDKREAGESTGESESGLPRITGNRRDPPQTISFENIVEQIRTVGGPLDHLRRTALQSSLLGRDPRSPSPTMAETDPARVTGSPEANVFDSLGDEIRQRARELQELRADNVTLGYRLNIEQYRAMDGRILQSPVIRPPDPPVLPKPVPPRTKLKFNGKRRITLAGKRGDETE